MRLGILFAAYLCGAVTVRAETFVFASLAAEKTIRVFRLEPSDGVLIKVEDVPLDGAPGSLAVDPAKRFLFASVRSNATLVSFAIDAKTGRLKKVGAAQLGKEENAAFVRVDPSGNFLISASYTGGKVVVHRLKDGAFEEPAVQSIKTAVTAHSATFDPEARFVFVPHVTPNAIRQFAFDPKTGTLTERGEAQGGTPKAGPRHLAFHPSLPLAFSSDEVGSSITAYRFDKEKGLTPTETLSTLPADFKGSNTTAEVKVHPSGKYVWVSNRGHDSLAGFAVDLTSGRLKSLGQSPTEKTPRSFEIDPEGKYLFGAGEGTGKIRTYRIDTGTGQLESLRTTDVGQRVTWVMAVKFE